MVRSLIKRSTAAGSSACVAGSMSQNTGVICCHCSACAVATKVIAGTITSPLIGRARIAISRPMVALHTAITWRTPRYEASAASSSRTHSPLLVNQRESRMRSTRAMNQARSPRFGWPTCNVRSKAGAPPNSPSSSRDVLKPDAKRYLRFAAMAVAGLPITVLNGGTLFVTTAPMPTTAPSPMTIGLPCAPSRITTPVPM